MTTDHDDAPHEHEIPVPDWLFVAGRHWSRIGGFNSNGVDELGPAGMLAALVGIGYELRRIADALCEPRTTEPVSRSRFGRRGSRSAPQEDS